MEQYAFEQGKLILIDAALGLNYEEAFSPVLLSEPFEEGRPLGEGHRLCIRAHEGAVYAYEIEQQGVLDGQAWLLYPQSQKVKREAFYRKGVLHGPTTFHSEKGTILAKGWFLNGKQEGKCYRYFASGELHSLQQFRHGIYEGIQRFYYRQGQLKTVMEYRQGKLSGTVVLYYPDGTLKRKIAITDL